MTNRNSTCIACGQQLPEEDKAVVTLLTSHKNWSAWAAAGMGYVAEINGKPVEVIAVAVIEEERNYGGDIQATLVFLVDGVLYRKIGVTSSYGSTSWDGPLTRVVPKTQIIKSWDRA